MDFSSRSQSEIGDSQLSAAQEEDSGCHKPTEMESVRPEAVLENVKDPNILLNTNSTESTVQSAGDLQNEVDSSSGRHLFTCPRKNCPFSFKNFKELEEHANIHNRELDFFCDVCERPFFSFWGAMLHVKGREKMECCECRKKWPSLSDLNRHLCSHTGKKPFEETRDDQVKMEVEPKDDGLRRGAELNAEDFLDSAEEKPRLLFTCPLANCPSSYNTFKELEEHMRVHPDAQDFVCDVCNTKFPSEVEAMAHIQERKTKECCACGRKCREYFNLLQHLRYHTGEKPFACMTCGRRFAISNVLKTHMIAHTGQFSCGHCKKRCATKDQLEVHERTHTGEKPFHCEHCGFKTGNSSYLKIHNRRHTGEKPYGCGYCEKRFYESGSRKSHEMTHTGEKPFECKECGGRFSLKSILTTHMLIHTGEKPFSCEKCDQKFTRNDGLKKHMEKMHPQ